jgi:hypothetical protein
MTAEQVFKLMQAETHLYGKEVVDLGLAHEVIADKFGPNGPIRLPEGDGIIDHSGGNDPSYLQRGPYRCP